MLKLPTTEQLVKQAIKANLKQFREARKDHRYWADKMREFPRESNQYLKYENFADQHFYEFVTIKDTLIRLFPDHEELIVDKLYID